MNIESTEYRRQRAIQAARESAPIRLLCRHGHFDAARTLCDQHPIMEELDDGTSTSAERLKRDMMVAATELEKDNNKE